MAPTLYLGIEGGASRTTGVLADAEGKVLARATAGPANVHAVGEEAARQAVADVAAALLADAAVAWADVAAAALCLSGLRLASDAERWRRLVADVGMGCPVHLTHDAAAGLAAGSRDGTGILVISGTGSLAHGRRGDGREHTVGGRGPLLGDEGSGFDIAHQGLRAAARSLDDRGPRTALARLIPAGVGVGSFDALLTHLGPFAKERVAAVAPIVFAAARSGDAVAAGVVASAVESLARSAAAVARRLWPAGDVPRVVLAGGVLRGQEGFREALAERVRAVAPDAGCGLPEVDGAVGAARVARRWLEQQR